jgi:hypothetical protein
MRMMRDAPGLVRTCESASRVSDHTAHMRISR